VNLGPEQRVNESVGPIAIEAALATMKRVKKRGNTLSLKQQNSLKKTLFRLSRFVWHGQRTLGVIPSLH